MRHKHHIIPRHAGGTDDPSNIVELTISEHADAHWLLWSEYKSPFDKLAAQCLDGMIGKEDIIRQAHIANGKTRKGIPKSEETKKKMSLAKKGIPKSEEHKRKLSKPVNIYCYYTDELIAVDVVLRQWSIQHGYSQGHLHNTITGVRKQHKGLYAKYI